MPSQEGHRVIGKSLIMPSARTRARGISNDAAVFLSAPEAVDARSNSALRLGDGGKCAAACLPVEARFDYR